MCTLKMSRMSRWKRERNARRLEKRELSQWFLSITKYANDLLKEIDQLSKWPDKVRIMQKNWIGKSEGAEISFELEKKNFKTHQMYMRKMLELRYLRASCHR